LIDEPGIAGIAGRDQHVADEPVAADALDRRAAEEGPEGRIVERQEFGDAGSFRSSRACSFISEARGKLVPRAGGQAVVAAIDPVADQRPDSGSIGPLCSIVR
jgi:hypothetical protein